MHKIIQNLIDIQKKIDSNLESLTINKVPKIIAVSKTFGMDKISPLINHGHLDFGENKVQEAIEKWSDVKSNNANIKLHLIGGLQTNKVKLAVRLFDFIHSVDSEKLAQKISNEQQKQKKSQSQVTGTHKFMLLFTYILYNSNSSSGSIDLTSRLGSGAIVEVLNSFFANSFFIRLLSRASASFRARKAASSPLPEPWVPLLSRS